MKIIGWQLRRLLFFASITVVGGTSAIISISPPEHQTRKRQKRSPSQQSWWSSASWRCDGRSERNELEPSIGCSGGKKSASPGQRKHRLQHVRDRGCALTECSTTTAPGGDRFRSSGGCAGALHAKYMGTRDVDFKRSVKVGLLGILLNGFALGAWYRVLDRYLGAERTRITTVLKKCVVDQMVYAPFSITSFVSYAAVLNGGGVDNILKETGRNLRETFWSTWLMDWKVWPAANLVMFRLIPSSYRPSFASIVQVAWQAYMSSVSYDSPHHASTLPDKGDPLAMRGGSTGQVGAVLPQGAPLHSPPPPASSAPLVTQRPRPVMDRRATGRYAYRPRDDRSQAPEEGVARALPPETVPASRKSHDISEFAPDKCKKL